MLKLSLSFLFILGCLIYSSGQSLTIRKTSGQIVLDGKLNESAWTASDSAYNFIQQFPSDTSLALAQTTVYILYDENFIYVGARLENLAGPRKYITPSLRRDFRGAANDSFSVIFDTFKDKTNAVLFGINPFGVRREGLISNGGAGRSGLSLDWDNKWDGEAKQYDGFWIVEMAIPFKTLRFTEDQSSWNVNFYRVDSEYTEKSTWSPIARNLTIINIGTVQEMMWDKPTKKPGANISLIPYTSGGLSRDFEVSDNYDSDLMAGFDMKYGITSGLNLDLTVNPDFSQVEVDQQVTNLDRFEIFFPERRQFFLENADLFADFGTRRTRPFFSRRIGIARDESTGQNIQNTIPLGMRVSGKVGNNTRIGLMNMQGGKNENILQPATNYTVLSTQQKVFDRSNIGFIFVNKDPFKLNLEDTTVDDSSNRTAGLDFNIATPDNRWNGKIFYHRSFEEGQNDSAFAMGGNMLYTTNTIRASIFTQSIGAGYNPEVGFVRRTDINQLAANIRFSLYPSSGIIQSHGPGFDFDMIRNDTYGFLDWDVNVLYDITFRNNANYRMRLRRQYTFLFNEFDPSGSNGQELPANTSYTANLIFADFESDARKKIFYSLGTRSGQYYNGIRLNLDGSVGYRYQPFGFTSIDFSYNYIKLPLPYNTSNLFLIGPRFDFTFTRKLFWTTFVQYNSQIENLNVNSRLQWRFKPVSDMYLVYTDNYLAYSDEDNLFALGAPKSRALVFKITYWLNL
ncbi:MAG: carbohydrate binding family 9 domain-containing protein [Cyclobacteriaceae bacterium]